MAPTTTRLDALEALAATVQDDLRRLGEPARPWPTTPAGVDHDVLIVGAGQCGLAAAFALKRAGIDKNNPDGVQPDVEYVRPRQLRFGRQADQPRRITASGSANGASQ